MPLTQTSMVSSAVSAAQSDLLHRCAAGDAGAWRGLHQRYHGNAVAVLRRLGVPRNQLEDACQDVFVDVFQYLPRFRGEADFRTWLYRICVSRARTSRRRARLWAVFTATLPQSSEELGGVPLDESIASRRLAGALERLTDAERVVFVLFELEGLSGKEISQVIERPEATVFRRLHDARKRFTAAIEDA